MKHYAYLMLKINKYHQTCAQARWPFHYFITSVKWTGSKNSIFGLGWIGPNLHFTVQHFKYSSL